MKLWHEVFRHLAELLRTHHRNHRGAASKMLYQKLTAPAKSVRFPSVWLSSKAVDPIQLFAFIAGAGKSDDLRLHVLKAILESLGSKKVGEIKEVDFKGCPFPISAKITSYRVTKQQTEIWNVFVKIFDERQDGLTSSIYEKARTWNGIGTASFTIFLFWIDPMNFLPLDKNTDRILLEAGIYSASPDSYHEYRQLIPAPETPFYLFFAAIAYDPHNEKNYLKSFSLIKQFYGLDDGKPQGHVDFRLVAICPRPGLSDRYRKVLTENYFYRFYQCFDFTNQDEIVYDRSRDLKLFSNNMNINVSAIVGKNGSGKSSLTELLYLALNNLAAAYLRPETELNGQDDAHIDLYFFSETLYRVAIVQKEVFVYEYGTNDTDPVKAEKVIYKLANTLPRAKSFLRRFFYSVAVNYSHYALNSSENLQWIANVFHKNDAYQAPLVVNPMRNKGTIDINVEKDLVHSRLLVNILDSANADLRELVENKFVKTIALFPNYEKIEMLSNGEKFPSPAIVTPRIRAIRNFFSIPDQPISRELLLLAERYIFKKLHSICLRYPLYQKHMSSLKGNFSAKKFKSLLDAIEIDHSHITFKLRQAMNYLKHNHFQSIPMNTDIEVELIADCIDILKARPDMTGTPNIELLPPAFFKLQIKFTDGSDFDRLSSGEKQKIHTVQSVIYHLVNIDSIADRKELIKYRYINIIFDEVELYFHPEMQREFVHYLLDYISRISFQRILGLNICFVTHSPFILSDIPNDNIIFLSIDPSTGTAIQRRREETFAGNIHDMLKDNFYLTNGYMGEFAKETIQSLINFLTESKDEKPFGKAIRQEWDEISADRCIELIGEPLLKSSLRSLFRKIFVNEKIERINMDIADLEKQKKRLLQKGAL